jgi:hypothetical protein
MLEIYSNPGLGEDYNLLFKTFKEDVIADHLKVFDKEDVNGWDCGHLNSALWYMAFMYSILYKKDYLSGLYNASDLRVKYKLNELKRCLECRKIPILYMLELLGVITAVSSVYGVNTMTVESSFIVEAAQCNPPIEEEQGGLLGTSEGIALFQSLWESESNCQILLNSNC